MTDKQAVNKDEHRALKSNNIMVVTLVSLFSPWPPPPPHAASLLSIQPLNCPKEKGEGRYESAYLLAFVQWTALSVRGGVAHQLPCMLAVVSSRFLVTTWTSNICRRFYCKYGQGWRFQTAVCWWENSIINSATCRRGSLPNLCITGCVEGSRQEKKKKKKCQTKPHFIPDMCDKKGERWHHLGIRLRQFSI